LLVFTEKNYIRRTGFNQSLLMLFAIPGSLEGGIITFVASSTPTPSSAHLTSSFSTSSPTRISRQSLPTNLGSLVLCPGGWLRSSWTLAWEKDGCLWVRGECLKFSAKLERWLMEPPLLDRLGLAVLLRDGRSTWSAISILREGEWCWLLHRER